MVWQLVLTAPSSVATSAHKIEQVGEIVAIPDPFTSHVTVKMVPGGEVRSVHMAWADRPESFASFLELCIDTFRLHVGICAQSVVSFSLYVNPEEVHRQLDTIGFVAGEPFAVALIQKFAAEATLPKCASPCHTAAATPNTTAITRLRVGWTLPLRPFQRMSVDWLHLVESSIASGYEIVSSPVIPITSRVSFDPRTISLRHDTVAVSRTPYRGAVLANDVGTGKTCCVIRLVAEEPVEGTPRLVPPQHALFSPATIVVCPVGMQQHWRDEVRKFAPALRVVMLTSAREMKATNLWKLVRECDICVTTHTWVRSKVNTEATDELVGQTLHLEPDRRVVRKSVVPASRGLSKLPTEALTEMPATIGLVTFRRCVIDEAHDVLGASSARRERLRACQSVRALTWFGLTATPNVSDAAALHEWANILLESPEDTPHPALARQMEDQLIRSFTSASERRGALQQTLHRVVLSVFERALLEAHDDTCRSTDANYTTRIIQMCSSAGAHFHDRLHSVDDVLQTLLASQEEQLAELRALDNINETTTSMISTLEARRRFVEHVFTQGLQDMQCPICLEQKKEDTKGLIWTALGCGHVICTACVKKIPGGQQRTCPVCRDVIQTTMRVVVGARSEMLRSRGSKLERAAALLRTLMPSKVIVVATWKPLLLSLKETLLDTSTDMQSLDTAANVGVMAEVLEGSAPRRTAILRRFREASTSVLLLLSHGGFEGHDLSAASHIVFMHALAEATDEALRIEHQVLGRVQRNDSIDVHVHYLVAADTHEEHLWSIQHTAAAHVTTDHTFFQSE